MIRLLNTDLQFFQRIVFLRPPVSAIGLDRRLPPGNRIADQNIQISPNPEHFGLLLRPDPAVDLFKIFPGLPVLVLYDCWNVVIFLQDIASSIGNGRRETNAVEFKLIPQRMAGKHTVLRQIYNLSRMHLHFFSVYKKRRRPFCNIPEHTVRQPALRIDPGPAKRVTVYK